MRVVSSAALSLVLVAWPLSAATVERLPPDRPPSMMTSREIAAFNDGLKPTHPYYIKCRRLEETGSLVKKARVCRTNKDWRIASDLGNQNVRDTLEAFTKAPVNSSN